MKSNIIYRLIHIHHFLIAFYFPVINFVVINGSLEPFLLSQSFSQNFRSPLELSYEGLPKYVVQQTALSKFAIKYSSEVPTVCRAASRAISRALKILNSKISIDQLAYCEKSCNSIRIESRIG
ncbi:hypothetical protein C0J52_19531 [Blattella germanica]|nr:hypothetical protein C0J52_19531 [Blattella germanica]